MKLCEALHSYAIIALALVLYAGCIGLWAERQIRLTALENREDPNVKDRARILPNYHHVNNHRDPLYDDLGYGKLSKFGNDFVNASAAGVKDLWRHLCPMDSDGDKQTNGEELGDPCCRWETAEPNHAFDLAKGEWRRWGLSDPGLQEPGDRPAQRFVDNDGRSHLLRPGDCQHYHREQYEEVFVQFYYKDVRNPVAGYPPVLKHYIGVGLTLVTSLHLLLNKGLLADMMPVLFKSAPLSLRTSVCMHVSALLYIDLLSGIAHLMLDYMPPWIPVVGVVANGFQEHHTHPALLARKPTWNQVNDIFIFAPGVMVLLSFGKLTRATRLFFVWAFAYGILVLLIHPWAHMFPDQVPLPVRVLQRMGVLLNQEMHQRHHGDLESQFTILSGYGDLVIDHLSMLIPAYRYDMWSFVLMTVVLTPVLVDYLCRAWLESLEKKEHVDEWRHNKIHLV